MSLFKHCSGPAARFHVRRGGQNLGDFNLEELVAAMEAGRFEPTDEMRPEGSDQWVSISTPVQATVTKTIRAATLLERLLAPTPPLGSAPATRLSFLGDGLMSAGGLVSGGGLMALFVVVLFVWGTLDMNRGGAQEQQIDALRDKIVAYINAHPDFSAATPLEMEQCPALDDTDRKLVESLKLVLNPVNAGSPPESIVILRPRSDGQRMYYKDGKNDFVMRWRARAGSDVAVESSPLPPPAKGRLVRVLRDGQTIHEYTSGAISVTTIWRGDGRFAAVNERARDRERMKLIAIAGNTPETIDAPDSCAPAALFEPQDMDAPEGEVRWLSDEVSAQRWLSSGELEAESFGNIMVIGADRLPARYVSVRQRFRLALSEDGTIAVVGSDPPQFHRSLPKGPVRPIPPLPVD